MSRNYYSEIHLHMVWHVKDSKPWLTPSVEKVVHDYLRGYVVRTPGAFVHEIGGTETHVHMAATGAADPRDQRIDREAQGFIGSRSQRQAGPKCLEWQSGYGVVSFGTKDLVGSGPISGIRRSTTLTERFMTGWSALRLMRLKPNIPVNRGRMVSSPRIPAVNGGPITAKGRKPGEPG